MRAYVTGPAFSDAVAATALLHRHGWQASSAADTPESVALSLRASLAWSSRQVMEADALVVTDGWESHSETAVAIALADALSVPVLSMNDALAMEPAPKLA